MIQADIAPIIFTPLPNHTVNFTIEVQEVNEWPLTQHLAIKPNRRPSIYCQYNWDHAYMNESYIGLRSDLLKYIIQKNCSVLDVGCATGVNGKWLINEGIARKLVGIEYDKEMADHAIKHYSQVFNIDLNRSDQLPRLLCDQKFDYIILGDILEHLIDPWSILNQLTQLLAPSGRIIMSIPNIGHIDTFIHIFIKGYWPYNSRGIFDKTHLRFFTLKNISDLVKEAGLTSLKIEPKFRYRDAMNSKFPFYGSVLKKLFPSLYTFQYIVVCSHSTAAP